MPRANLIATLLRSIADLLENPDESSFLRGVEAGKRKRAVGLPTEPSYTMGVDPAEPGADSTVTEERTIDIMDRELEEMGKEATDQIDRAVLEAAKVMCKTCINGGRGRHKAGCSRGAGPVTEYKDPLLEPYRVGAGIDPEPEPEKPYAPPAAKSEWESEDEPADDLKSFDCEGCGKTFKADPSDVVRCACGSNSVWPSAE